MKAGAAEEEAAVQVSGDCARAKDRERGRERGRGLKEREREDERDGERKSGRKKEGVREEGGAWGVSLREFDNKSSYFVQSGQFELSASGCGPLPRWKICKRSTGVHQRSQ